MHSRSYATKSSYSTLYAETFPAMVPVFLLGSVIFFGLQLTQSKLSHDKYMREATQQVLALEAEIDALQRNRVESPTAPIPDLSLKKSSRWWPWWK
ncbi:hypothetical protein BYT27DRAFT_7108842 [Phlegmacium glaucopus]|nr:hypothetical protein BYT27DRAFT_7108842 [Phlegmacium glaucopus]